MRLKNWKDGNGRSLDCGEEEDGRNDSLGPSCLLAKWAIACSSAIREEEAGSFRLKDTFDRTQRRPTSSLPSLAEAAAPVCSYFRCLLLCTFAGTANTSPACWPWPGTFFRQFTLLGKSDPPGQHAAGCWRLIVIFTAFVTLCCAWSCFLLQERLVCCDGEGRLASAPVHRLQGSGQEMVNDFLGQPTGEGGSLLICICIYIYFQTHAEVSLWSRNSPNSLWLLPWVWESERESAAEQTDYIIQWPQRSIKNSDYILNSQENKTL